MKQRIWYIIFFSCVLVILVVYYRWFYGGVISAPDYTYLYSERLQDFGWLPKAWSGVGGIGAGGSAFAQLNLNTYLHIGINLFVFLFHIPWQVASRLMFFWPFLFIGFIGSVYFIRSILKGTVSAYLGALIYLTNTYILMIAGGGQIGLMMAYAVAPIVFGSFIRRDRRLFTAASVGFLIFDIRYAYLLFATIGMYVISMIPRSRWRETFHFFLPSVLWIMACNAFWLIPLFFAPSFGLPQGYDDPGWVRYLSWADLSRTLSFLHPNWPENIFGKTYFMRPEFIALPVVVFMQFLFIAIRNKSHYALTYFFALLLLVAAFLAKGANEPFGAVYTWLFTHVPMFSGFRDPTKFYLLLALAYSVLLPSALEEIQEWLRAQKQKYSRQLSVCLPLIFVSIWIGVFLAPVWKGELHGTFEHVSIGSEYINFEKLVQNDASFYRTLSVPWRQRFIVQSERHPLLNASDVFASSDVPVIIEKIQDPGFERILQSLAIRYVVVPDDIHHEIFLTDRSYDPEIKKNFVDALDTIPFLTKRSDFSGFIVYEYKKQIGHFYRTLENLDVVREQEIRRSAVSYTLEIDTAERPVNIIFSETYDPAWRMWDGEKYVQSKKTSGGLNSFILDTNLTSHVIVDYANQKILSISYWVTAVSVFLLLLLRLIHKKKPVAALGIALCLAAGLVYPIARDNYLKHDARTNLISDAKRFLLSPQWRILHDPQTDSYSLGSRIGGSTIHFSVANTKSLIMEAESGNKEQHEQVLKVTVRGKEYELASPFAEKKLIIPVDSAMPNDAAEIVLTLYCDSAMVPCDVRITRMTADRGAVISSPNIPPLKTLAILGDSLTTSFGERNYSYTLAQKLGARMHNASVFGSAVSPVPGWDSALRRLSNDITVFTPDYVMLFVGTNDLGRGVPLIDFRRNYSSLLKQIKLNSPRTKIFSVGLLTRNDYPETEVKSYSNIIKEAAREEGVPYIDPIRWLRPSDLKDGVHPSIESQETLAEYFYRVLQPLMN